MSVALRPSVDPTSQRRRLHLAAALAALHVRTALVPATSTRRRQRVQVCGAARILTALGVRVQVIAPATPWPRHRPCRLAVGDDVGRLGGLALVTGVPRTTAGWRAVCDRVLPGRPSSADAVDPDAVDPDAVACPVVIRYRTDAGPLDRPPGSLAEIVALRGLVVEVHLLPALDLSVPPRRTLARAAA